MSPLHGMFPLYGSVRWQCGSGSLSRFAMISAVSYCWWHFMQCEVPMVPCRFTMMSLLLPAFSCNASKFCVASSVSMPACSSLTSALCAVPGCAFHTGDSFCQRQEYSRSSSLARKASMSYTFICSGCLVHTPSGPRKSGMPAEVEMPAPVNTAIFLLMRTTLRLLYACNECCEASSVL